MTGAFFVANFHIRRHKKMLSYTEFKDRVLNEFLDYLPAKYKDCEVKIHEIPKVNKMLTGVVIVPKKKDKSKKGMIMPTFYLERLYEQYLETGNFENMMQKQAVYLEQSAKYLPEELFETKFEDYQNKVVFQLVNTLENLVLLSKCPHRSFEDLSVVYRAITKCDSCGVSGFLITNDVAQSMNWTEEFLYEKALTNTRMLFPFVHMRIEEMMMKIMGAGRSKESISKLFPEYEHMSAEECVYVITNKAQFYGSSALLYPEVIGRVADKIGTDCYVLPSSLHEIIVLSANAYSDKNKLVSIISGTNEKHVREEEKLSDSLYFFDIKNRYVKRIKTDDAVAS